MNKTKTLASLALLFAVAGCGGDTEKTTPKPGAESTQDAKTETPRRKLASYQTYGGLCFSAEDQAGQPCGGKTEFYSNGDYVSKDGTGKVISKGKISEDKTKSLIAAVGKTQVGPKKKFTGTCPVAYDGSAVVVAYRNLEGKWVKVDSCKWTLPENDPLLEVLADIP